MSYEVLNVLPYDWRDEDCELSSKKETQKIENVEPDRFRIHIWAFNNDREKNLLRVDFDPFLRVILPTKVAGYDFLWTNTRIESLISRLYSNIKYQPKRYDFDYKKKLYNFNPKVTVEDAVAGLPEEEYEVKKNGPPPINKHKGKYKILSKEGDVVKVQVRNKIYTIESTKYPVLTLYFNSLTTMRSCAYYLRSNPIMPEITSMKEIPLPFGVFEDKKIPVYVKLAAARKLKISDWLRTKAIRVDTKFKISKLKNEFWVHWEDLNQVPPEEIHNFNVKPKIMSVDIEAMTDNHKAMPIKFAANHKSYLIVLTFQIYNEPETRKRYAILIGHSSRINFKSTELCIVKDELHYHKVINQIIAKEKPDVRIGYNIFGFDDSYLDARIKRLGLDWDPVASLLLKRGPYIDDLSWSSSGTGYNNFQVLEYPGMIAIDLLPDLKRAGYKWLKYDLDTAGRELLGRGKHPIKAKEQFEIVDEYELSNFIYKKCFPGCSEDLWDLSLDDINNYIVKPAEKYKKADFITMKLAQEVLLRYKKALDNMKRLVEYCIEDAELCMDIFDKIGKWIDLLETSNVVSTTITNLFKRGQQLRGISLLYKYIYAAGYVMDRVELPFDPYDGAFVKEPKPGVKRKTVTGDFKSLYPNIAREGNICYSTFINPECFDLIPEELCNIYQWVDEMDEEKMKKKNDMAKAKRRDVAELTGDDEDSDDEEEIAGEVVDKKKKKIIITKNDYRYIIPEIYEGFIPKIESDLINGRFEVRERIKTEVDKLMKLVLDRRQNALKITANSMYGIPAVQIGGYLPYVVLAKCITFRGRQLIQWVNSEAENNYGCEVSYNDTDSFMFSPKNPDSVPDDQLFVWGKKVIDGINAVLPKPLEIEQEKFGTLFCIRKKKYVYWLMNKDGSYKPLFKPDGSFNNSSVLWKGIVLARRDNCSIQRDMFQEGVIAILLNKGINYFLDKICKYIVKLVLGKINWKELVVVKSVATNYVSENFHMKIFADELRSRGISVSAGDRLDYLVVIPKNYVKDMNLGYRMRLPEEYLEGNEQIDYGYYIDHMIKNSIEQIFQVAYNEEVKKIEDKNDRDTASAMMNELFKSGFEKLIRQEVIFTGDMVSAIQSLCNRNRTFAKKMDEVRKEFVTGRGLFDYRLSSNFIKTIYKGYMRGNDDFWKVIQEFMTPEGYKEMISEFSL